MDPENILFETFNVFARDVVGKGRTTYDISGRQPGKTTFENTLYVGSLKSIPEVSEVIVGMSYQCPRVISKPFYLNRNVHDESEITLEFYPGMRTGMIYRALSSQEMMTLGNLILPAYEMHRNSPNRALSAQEFVEQLNESYRRKAREEITAERHRDASLKIS